MVVHVDLGTFVETARQTMDADADAGEAPADERPTESGFTTDRAVPVAVKTPPKGRPTPRRPDRTPRRPARLEDGPALWPALVQQLACDGRIQLSVDGPDGRTLDLGRRRRRPTNRQIVALWRRDHGCAVPGCGRTRFLHAHHVRPWALGGKTSLDNLVLLCGEHHRLLHDGAFRIVTLGQQRFRFRGTAGRPVPSAPQLTGNAEALARAHGDVAPTTIEPDWEGSPLHLDDAVAGYLTAWQSQAA